MKEDSENDNLDAFIALSRRTKSSGDLEHAEKLLIGGLKRAEESMNRAESSVVRFLEELIVIYETQGRAQDAERVRKRMEDVVLKRQAR